MKMKEIQEAASLVQEQAHEDANIIFGASIDEIDGRSHQGHRHRDRLRPRRARNRRRVPARSAPQRAEPPRKSRPANDGLDPHGRRARVVAGPGDAGSSCRAAQRKSPLPETARKWAFPSATGSRSRARSAAARSTRTPSGTFPRFSDGRAVDKSATAGGRVSAEVAAGPCGRTAVVCSRSRCCWHPPALRRRPGVRRSRPEWHRWFRVKSSPASARSINSKRR